MIDSMERYSVLLEEDARASTISAETLETTTSLCMEVVGKPKSEGGHSYGPVGPDFIELLKDSGHYR